MINQTEENSLFQKISLALNTFLFGISLYNGMYIDELDNFCPVLFFLNQALINISYLNDPNHRVVPLENKLILSISGTSIAALDWLCGRGTVLFFKFPMAISTGLSVLDALQSVENRSTRNSL